MLFLRDYLGPNGGHLKYLHYLGHTLAAGIEATLYLTPRSLGDETNPFLSAGARLATTLAPFPSYFVAGMGWRLLDAAGVDPGDRPVVNLVQGVSHAREDDPKSAFLSRPALRICVSAEVAAAILATKRVRGDVVVIENGVDLPETQIARPAAARSTVFIGGLKAPELARVLARDLATTMPVDAVDGFLPRAEFLERMARARFCILLPKAEEGFFLPALEAMALGVPVIVPDCVGNRGFCRDGDTCVVPPFEAGAIAAAARALYEDDARLAELAAGGLSAARTHTLAREREAYHRVLRDFLGDRWPQ